MPSLLKILSQMTGLQKLSVARNLIVLPLLLLSFTLDGGILGFTAPIVLPWVLYMGFNLGSNSHRLQAINGFQLASPPPTYRGLSAKALYIVSCVIGMAYIGAIAALLPDVDNAAAPRALQVAMIGAVFIGAFLTVAGIRMGWSSIEDCAQGTDPAKVLRLVNPAGVKRQQLIYLAAGFFVLIGSLSSLSHTYPRWAGDGSGGSASVAQDDQSLASFLSDNSATSTDQQQTAPAEPASTVLPAAAIPSAATPVVATPVAAAPAVAAPPSGLPSLCTANESTIWSGTKGSQMFSVCASIDLSATTGYLQYRAGTAGSTPFKYPATLANPHGLFSYIEGAHSAEIDFSNEGYAYAISEQADGSETDINVTLPSGKTSTIVLDKASETIGQNATSDLFKKLGLSP
jgi:hypothetical protein